MLTTQLQTEIMMPAQVQQSNLLQRFGVRIAKANAEHKDAPLDLGFKRLPPGIKNGVAKLTSFTLKEYAQDEKIAALRGQEYFHAVAVALSPKQQDGVAVEGVQFSQRFPLCDIPANPDNQFSKPKSFNTTWGEFLQCLLCFGIKPSQSLDPSGAEQWAYYQAAVKTLNSSQPPRTFEFTTRGWTPPKTTAEPNPKERVYEDWGVQCEWNGQADPGAGVTVQQSNGVASSHYLQPPPTEPMISTTPSTDLPFSGDVEPAQLRHAFAQQDYTDQADLIAALVEVAMADLEQTSTLGTDGNKASIQLAEFAEANGWTQQQMDNAVDWVALGDMALNPPESTLPTDTMTTTVLSPAPVAVGTRHRFAKRDKNGVKLKDNKGKEFPAHEVEITSVDPTANTCTVKTVKDGKDVIDIRTKKPTAVKFEWLE